MSVMLKSSFFEKKIDLRPKFRKVLSVTY
jgi:hypothetical protein